MIGRSSNVGGPGGTGGAEPLSPIGGDKGHSESLTSGIGKGTRVSGDVSRQSEIYEGYQSDEVSRWLQGTHGDDTSTSPTGRFAEESEVAHNALHPE